MSSDRRRSRSHETGASVWQSYPFPGVIVTKRVACVYPCRPVTTTVVKFGTVCSMAWCKRAEGLAGRRPRHQPRHPRQRVPICGTYATCAGETLCEGPATDAVLCPEYALCNVAVVVR